MFIDGHQQDGYVRGRIDKSFELVGPMPKKKEKHQNITWYHNPITMEKMKIKNGSPVPDGLIKGTGRKPTDEENDRRRSSLGKRKWITNTTTLIEAMIMENEPIPDGWVLGSFTTNNRKCPKTGRLC